MTNLNSSNVSAYTIDSTTGAITEVAGSPFAAQNYPHSVAVDPTGKFAYVVNLGNSNVSAYTIDASTGALTPVAGSPFAAGSGSRSAPTKPMPRLRCIEPSAPRSQSRPPAR